MRERWGGCRGSGGPGGWGGISGIGEARQTWGCKASWGEEQEQDFSTSLEGPPTRESRPDPECEAPRPGAGTSGQMDLRTWNLPIPWTPPGLQK